MSIKERSAERALCEAFEGCFYRLSVERPPEDSIPPVRVAGERGLRPGGRLRTVLARTAPASAVRAQGGRLGDRGRAGVPGPKLPTLLSP